jgi:hypothetical protein
VRPALNDVDNACDREAAWLAQVDTLPSLLSVNGGPFKIVQSYLNRTPETRVPALYVTRSEIDDDRESNQRIVPRYDFVLRINWPVDLGSGMGEASQRSLDVAIKLVLQRIRGLVGDKSHGGRFLSVGENPRRVRVLYDDPEKGLEDSLLTARILYSADELEITG